ncbi:hypothetical protein AVEN_141403-1 [Araneus ventricosus]|uniref:Secreted protein n=1 Tax=Araneus ventricosus TaxID=182803 RepID=A0A4Y2D0I7_ARAVE|nr:hypothetical protein AVEN_141403-1 [Araneus ventricosus]
MSTERACLFAASFEVITLCNCAFCASFIQRCECGLRASFCRILLCFHRCTSSELENHCPSSKFFIREKNHKPPSAASSCAFNAALLRNSRTVAPQANSSYEKTSFCGLP